MTFSKMTVSARRTCATFIAAAVAAAGSASAQQAACPPGSWFCESATPATPAPAAPAPAGSLQPLPPAAPAAAPAAPAAAAPPVVVYQPGPPVVVVQGKAEKPAPYPYSPRDPDARPRREWGLNLHMQGAMIGSGKDNDAGMGGMGLGLRYRPHPVVAIEPSIDFLRRSRLQRLPPRRDGLFDQHTALCDAPREGRAALLPRSASDGREPASVTARNGRRRLELQLLRHVRWHRPRVPRGATLRAQYGPPRIRPGPHRPRGGGPPRIRRRSRRTNTSGGGLFTLGMTFYF